MDRKELADFLRTRRARLTPPDVGLPHGERRRTPGLRREEVARLAGMSVDYYIRLEQARGPRPSRQILNALGRALMLNTDERAHLFHLAGETPAPAAGPRTDVPEGVRALLASMTEVPAYVMDAKYDIVAMNPLASLVMGGLDWVAPSERNVIRWIFGSPDLHEHLLDEEKSRFTRASVKDLRAAAARYPDDKGIQDLVAEMLALSPAFARLWADHDVEVRRDQRKRISHPMVGEIDIFCQVLHVPDRDQRVVFYTPQDEVAAARLRQLKEWSRRMLPVL